MHDLKPFCGFHLINGLSDAKQNKLVKLSPREMPFSPKQSHRAKALCELSQRATTASIWEGKEHAGITCHSNQGPDGPLCVWGIKNHYSFRCTVDSDKHWYINILKYINIKYLVFFFFNGLNQGMTLPLARWTSAVACSTVTPTYHFGELNFTYNTYTLQL